MCAEVEHSPNFSLFTLAYDNKQSWHGWMDSLEEGESIGCSLYIPSCDFIFRVKIRIFEMFGFKIVHFVGKRENQEWQIKDKS